MTYNGQEVSDHPQCWAAFDAIWEVQWGPRMERSIVSGGSWDL